MHSRREFLTTLALGLGTSTLAPTWSMAHVGLEALPRPQGGAMYGLIGKIIAAPGKRDELITILLNGTATMPGCRSYVIAEDPDDANAIWITEVWESKASHDGSLSLPSVKEAIASGRPLISGFGERIVTTPVGGIGLARQ
jgi:quinol monooxygenase YgiN